MATGTFVKPTVRSSGAPVFDLSGLIAATNLNGGSANTSAQQESSTAPRPSKLRLVAFGSSDKIFERVDSPNQCIFLRSTKIDSENRTAVQAVPIGWCLRQYVEPRSDVLDFTLSRATGMPTKDYDIGEDSDD
jgi:hypothetical protein